MSGTSADGIDAALVEFDTAGQCRLVHGIHKAWDDGVRRQLLEIGQARAEPGLDALGTLDVRVAEAFAAATLSLLDAAAVPASAVTAIGSHGQTIRHRPAGACGDGRHPFTLQLGDGNIIAERTGIATVADFRRRDVAAGGQGAPLLPALHAALLAAPGEDRAVLNLGGIANLTLLPGAGEGTAVRGFDTGPANALLDAWCERHTGHRYDDGGRWAAGGTLDDTLLQRLLAEPWFALPPPRSTGREQFHLDWVHARLAGTERARDVQATLLELTALTVAQALQREQPGTSRVLVCGGGVHNPVLMARLAALLPGTPVESTAGHGLDPDYIEAMGFAWLARRTLARLPGNLPAVTGAAGPRVLGVVYPAAS
ncbi:anhydro-N-acetylmuramic acid kinase [Lysobacter sp. GX 14042]|uniref:anhydro-N-acetylmuramic acid kinase n=1 Tax=Lysobacter sp. GX 14042 TaxID=2907155 RepID=UPI001F195A5F|nr:anhydro-N-acetylmuramic acid kinase [Lysobacter sp. GX 14042]MCE7032220.1 anhydro-N-acetylmuramic acid kinase [Lysobacter sp. GX 14042]